MTLRTLAHLSDLHLGRSPASDAEVARAVDSLDGVDHVIVSGDVTHRGRTDEHARFERLFAPLAARGRLTVVPGNHDRLGDDVGARLRRGARVQTVTTPGLFVVRVDSTGAHNRFLLAGHGDLCDAIFDDIDCAVAEAPPAHLVVVTMHHHLLPLPEETFPELLATRVGLPYATELRLGAALLSRLRGRCDLVLHGHRHVPRATRLFVGDARPLGLYNAGCTPSLGRFRVFAHAAGRLLGAPGWLVARDHVARVATARQLTGTEDR
ncbi:MAG: 3,5-cyclic-nucleotide phosphodiesterase [Myxococcales bacterium]|nr:3,5-cyclic-nucleotide phosphodiesterase [Myxococcales bacterium]